MLTRGRQCPVRPEEVGARRYDQQLGRGVVPAVVPSVDETLPTRDGRVISLAWQRGKGRQSGLEMDMEWAQIFTLRNGKVTRIDHYDTREAPLEATELSE